MYIWIRIGIWVGIRIIVECRGIGTECGLVDSE